MRGSYRPRIEEDEEESVFVPMTDMTVSFLFIVIILLAFFASQLSEDDTVPKSQYDAAIQQRNEAKQNLSRTQKELEELNGKFTKAEAKIKRLNDRVAQLETDLEEAKNELHESEAELVKIKEKIEHLMAEISVKEKQVEGLRKKIDEKIEEIARLTALLANDLERYFAAASEQRAALLRLIRNSLIAEFPDLNVTISSENDALRFQGEGLFKSGSARLQDARARKIVEQVAAVLNAELPCHSLGAQSRFSEDCNPAYSLIEAVLVEGHTDSDGTDSENLVLSAQRGAATVIQMLQSCPSLLEFKNLRDEPVLGLAGYGESRPVADNARSEGRSANRRIDLRVLMVMPTSSEEIGRIQESLRNAMSGHAPEGGLSCGS